MLATAGAVLAQGGKEQKVMNKIKALNKAVFADKDSVALNALLSDKVSFGHSTGKLEDKQEMIRNAVANTMTYEDFKMDSATVFIEGNTAIARHILKARTMDKGKEGVLRLGILQTWVKKKDKDWELVARQAVKLP